LTEEKIFVDQNHEPTEQDIKGSLKMSYKLWVELLKFIENNYGPVTKEWKFYGKGGWNCKVLLKKRNLFFFIPYNCFFRAGMVFGDKAINVIKKSDLPKNLIDELINSTKYAEGRETRLDIKDKNHLEILKKLVMVKIEN